MIAGTAKGRRLQTPPGDATRPITDRVKESLFGMLTPSLPGATVLDLYAGTGALAIEALSRGASRALLVERNRDVAAVARRNLASTGFTDRAEVVTAAVSAFLRRPAEAFDVVFVDPPYAVPSPQVGEELASVAQDWVDPGGLVVVRRRAGNELPPLPSGWRFTRERTYGDTLLLVASTA